MQMNDSAQQILNLTRVVTDAADAQFGKPVHIDVLPGFSTTLLVRPPAAYCGVDSASV
uniref:Uncharacterized protein n=1 Tax=Ralstonia solanacearum CFBP2957 TaxID=859656 RepID=D8P649_RALSL|nr:protein of unknown function [Ralstonia solanacearum CFBP2957]